MAFTSPSMDGRDLLRAFGLGAIVRLRRSHEVPRRHPAIGLRRLAGGGRSPAIPMNTASSLAAVLALVLLRAPARREPPLPSPSVPVQPGPAAVSGVAAAPAAGLPDRDPALAHKLVSAGAVLVDVRTPEEYATRHLDGAVNIPVDALKGRLDEIDKLTGGDKNKPIVVYCQAGGRAGRAKTALVESGHGQVTNLGGIADWDRNGRAATTPPVNDQDSAASRLVAAGRRLLGHLNIGQLLHGRATLPGSGERALLLWEDRVLTYADVYREAQRYAALFRATRAALVARGELSPGAPLGIGVYRDNAPSYLFAVLGAAIEGDVVVALNTGFRGDTLATLLDRAEVRLLLTSPVELAHLEPVLEGRRTLRRERGEGEEGRAPGMRTHDEALGEPAAGVAGRADGAAPLLVVYTSGTTGPPKGIGCSHLKLMGAGSSRGRASASARATAATSACPSSTRTPGSSGSCRSSCWAGASSSSGASARAPSRRTSSRTASRT